MPEPLLLILLAGSAGLLLFLSRSRLSLAARFAWVFFSAFIILLFARSWAVFFGWELNPDESQVLAQALRLRADPLPWRGFDGTTSGPIATYFASLAWMLSAHNPYASLRLLSLVLVCLSLAFFYLTAVLAVGARLAAAPFALLLLFYISSTQPDFVHHSSEVLPVFILSIQWFCLLFGLRRRWRHDMLAFALSFLAAAVFFTKPQAVPLSLISLLALAAKIAGADNPGPWKRTAASLLRSFLIPSAGAFICFFAAFLVPVAAGGALEDFWIRYVLLALEHKAPHNLSTAKTLRALLLSGWEGFAVILGLFALSTGALASHNGGLLRANTLLHLAVGVLFSLTASFSVLKSGQIFPHYLSLAVPACYAMTVSVLSGLSAAEDPARRTRARGPFAAAFFSAAALIFVHPQSELRANARRHAQVFRGDDALISYIRDHSREEDKLAVWGWTPHYYVRTGRTPAVRDIIGHILLTPQPRQAHYKKRFLEDLEKYSPRFVVDSVSDTSQALTPEWGRDIESLRLSACPVVGPYIRRHYAVSQKLRREGAMLDTILYELVE